MSKDPSFSINIFKGAGEAVHFLLGFGIFHIFQILLMIFNALMINIWPFFVEGLSEKTIDIFCVSIEAEEDTVSF